MRPACSPYTTAPCHRTTSATGGIRTHTVRVLNPVPLPLGYPGLAGVRGFEPRFTVSKTAVLPLDETPLKRYQRAFRRYSPVPTTPRGHYGHRPRGGRCPPRLRTWKSLLQRQVGLPIPPEGNGTDGGIRTHTVLILSQVPPANWATSAW